MIKHPSLILYEKYILNSFNNHYLKGKKPEINYLTYIYLKLS